VPFDGNEALECAPTDTIGPWRLIEKIGEGGMAEVWMAGRSDGLLARPVALKLPRRGWGNRLFCARLARERDILDSLNHPNIARLLDAGVASSGQPYLVIEYVEGKRIDEYCREHRLSAAARLELFLQVTKAIAFAHRSLVLHRDLKPSNILVTSEGEIRVLDFGIAKLPELGTEGRLRSRGGLSRWTMRRRNRLPDGRSP
jgi:serine/threonine-protein kinase